MPLYYYLASNHSLREHIPFYIHSYHSYYKQNRSFYKKGALNHHLILTLKGEGAVEVEKTKHSLSVGDILFYQADLPISYYPVSDDFMTCWLTFNGLGCKPLIKYYNLPKYKLFKDKDIESKIIEICKLADRFLTDELISVRLYALLTDFALKLNKASLPDTLENAINYIKNNYFNNISISDIASHSLVSESYLFRLFRKHLNTSPVAFINSIRIDCAKHYLEDHPSTPISEISKTVGFTSTSYFIESFKAIEGTTPSKYRREVLGIHKSQKSPY